MTDKPDRKNLGRGLSILLGELSVGSADNSETGQSGGMLGELVPIELLQPNPDQPRRDFKPDQLKELAASIKEGGIIQPLIVRKDPNSADGYIIVAGERRWRAAQIARLHEVPVVVRDYTESESLQVALMENIQRADLNAMEESEACRQLVERFGLTQEQLSASLGKSRSAIANSLRLLTLPEAVQALVRDGRLSAGHARALVGANDAVGLARQVVNLNLSVRQTEDLVRRASEADTKKSAFRGSDANTRVLESALSSALNAQVRIGLSRSGENGKIVVKFKTLEQLDLLCNLFNRAGTDLKSDF